MIGPDPAVASRRPGPDLRVEALRVAGDGGRTLLEVDSLHVAFGELVCVSGPSGAGKSTLLVALAGLGEPRAGTLSWGEETLAGAGAAARARCRARTLGLVFQQAHLFDELDARANAAIAAGWQPRARRRDLVERAERWLDALGLDPRDRRPVASYSGGERQRVALARALAHDPPVLLADEPTASLDREAADRLIDLLERVHDGGARTLLVASHDPSLIERARRRLTIADGRLVADSGIDDGESGGARGPVPAGDARARS